MMSLLNTAAVGLVNCIYYLY